MHVILPIIFLLKEQLCFFDNVGTDNVLFRNKKKLCLMKCCHLLEEIKNKVRFFFVFFSSIHATLSFSLTNTLFNFNNGEKSRKQQQKKILSFLFQTNFEMFSQDTISSINLLFLKRERYMSPQIASYQQTFKFNGSLCLSVFFFYVPIL